MILVMWFLFFKLKIVMLDYFLLSVKCEIMLLYHDKSQIV